MNNEKTSSAENCSDAAAGLIGDLINDNEGQVLLSDSNRDAYRSGGPQNKDQLSSSSGVGTAQIPNSTKMRHETHLSSKDLTPKNLRQPAIKVNKITSMKTQQNESNMIVVRSQDAQNFQELEGPKDTSPSFKDPYASHVHSLVGSSKYKNIKVRQSQNDGKEMNILLSPESNSRDVRGKVIRLNDTFSNEFNLNVRGSTKLMEAKALKKPPSRSPKKRDGTKSTHNSYNQSVQLNVQINKMDVQPKLMVPDLPSNIQVTNQRGLSRETDLKKSSTDEQGSTKMLVSDTANNKSRQQREMCQQTSDIVSMSGQDYLDLQSNLGPTPLNNQYPLQYNIDIFPNIQRMMQRGPSQPRFNPNNLFNQQQIYYINTQNQRNQNQMGNFELAGYQMSLNDPKSAGSSRSPRDHISERSKESKSPTSSRSPIHQIQVKQNEIELKPPKIPTAYKPSNFKQFVLTPINTQLVQTEAEQLEQQAAMFGQMFPPNYKLDQDRIFQQQVTHNIHAKIEAYSPSKKSYMDQTEMLLDTPTIGGNIAPKQFDKFRLIVNDGGGSPRKQTMYASRSPLKLDQQQTYDNHLQYKKSEDVLAAKRFQGQTGQQNTDLLDNSIKMENDPQLEKIIDKSEASLSGDENNKIQTQVATSPNQIQRGNRDDPNKASTLVSQAMIDSSATEMAERVGSKASSLTHRSFNKSGNRSPPGALREPTNPTSGGITSGLENGITSNLRISPRIGDDANQTVDMQAQTTFQSGFDQNEIASKIQQQQYNRQQLLNLNQIFQDSMMVINSTKMKLNDPSGREKKKSPAIAFSGPSNMATLPCNTDINFNLQQGQKKKSQKINVDVTGQRNFANKIQTFDSEGTINVDNVQETDPSQMSNSRQVSYSFGVRTAKSGNTQNQYMERVKKLHDQVFNQIHSERDTSTPTTQEQLAQATNIEDQKYTSFSHRQKVARNQGYQVQLNQDISSVDDQFNGFMVFLENEIFKIQQQTLQLQAQTKNTFPKGAQPQPFKQFSHSPFRKNKTTKANNNVKLNPLQKSKDQLKVQLEGKQINQVRNESVPVRISTDMPLAQVNSPKDTISIPSFQDKVFKGGSEMPNILSPRGSQRNSLKHNNIYMVGKSKEKFSRSQRDKIKLVSKESTESQMKDMFTSPKTPINEEQDLLNVAAGANDKASGDKVSGVGGPTTKKLSSRPSNNAEEEELPSSNNMIHSSFDRPIQNKKISGMALGGLSGQNDTKNKTMYNTQQETTNNMNIHKAVGKVEEEAAVIISKSQVTRKVTNISHNFVDQIKFEDVVNPPTKNQELLSPLTPEHSKKHSPSFHISERDTTKLYSKMLSWDRPRENQNLSSIDQAKEEKIANEIANDLNINQPDKQQLNSQNCQRSNGLGKRKSNIDKIQSHVEMKIKFIKDNNKQVSGTKSPQSTRHRRELDSPFQRKKQGRMGGMPHTNKLQSSISLPKTTQTLENNVMSVVGSSVQMEKFDIVGKNVIINSNMKMHENVQEVPSGIREVSEKETNLQNSIPMEREYKKQSKFNFVKKMNLSPRRIFNRQIQSTKNQKAAVYLYSSPLEDNVDDSLLDDSLLFNRHAQGGLPSLNRKNPKSWFFVSKQINQQKQLKKRYGETQSVSPTEKQNQTVKLPQTEIAQSPRRSNMQDSEQMSSSMNRKQVENVIQLMRDKPNTARNSSLRVAKLRKTFKDEEHPKTAAQSLRLRLPAKDQQMIKLLENSSDMTEHEQEILKQSLQKLIEESSGKYEQLLQLNFRERNRLQLQMHTSGKSQDSSNVPKPKAKDSSDNQMAEATAIQRNKLNKLHIQNVELNTNDDSQPKLNEIQTSRSGTQPAKGFLHFKRRPTGKLNSDITTIGGFGQETKRLFGQLKGKKILSPITKKTPSNMMTNRSVAKGIVDKLQQQEHQYQLLISDSQVELNKRHINASNNTSMIQNSKGSSQIEDKSVSQYNVLIPYDSKNADETMPNPAIEQSNLDSIKFIPSVNKDMSKDTTNFPPKRILTNNNNVTDVNNTPLRVPSKEGKLKQMGRLLESGQGQIKSDFDTIGFKVPSSFIRKKQGSDDTEQVDDIIKIVDLPKFSYQDTSTNENLNQTEQLNKTNSETENTMTNVRNPSLQEKSKQQEQFEKPSPLRHIQESPDQSEPAESKHYQDVQELDETPNATISNINENTDATDEYAALESTQPLDYSSQNIVQGQPLLKDTLHNLTHIPNNGYNDFFWYMDNAPSHRLMDRKKQTALELNVLLKKKQQREMLMHQRRRFLLSQVQFALDSSRMPEEPDEEQEDFSSGIRKRSIITNVTTNQHERSVEEPQNKMEPINKQIVSPDSQKAEEVVSLLEEIEREAQKSSNKMSLAGSAAITPSPMRQASVSKANKNASARVNRMDQEENLKSALAQTTSLSPVPQIGKVVCHAEEVDQDAVQDEPSNTGLGDRATLYIGSQQHKSPDQPPAIKDPVNIQESETGSPK